MALTWMEKVEAKSFKKGKAEGRAEGKGEAVNQMRELILQRIEQRFGPVPQSVQARSRRPSHWPALARMLEKLPLLQSPDDLLSHRRRVRISA